MFERLTKYNDKHGNRLVPYRYEEDSELGKATCINC